jgi:hypothetical protein
MTAAGVSLTTIFLEELNPSAVIKLVRQSQFSHRTQRIPFYSHQIRLEVSETVTSPYEPLYGLTWGFGRPTISVA